jgi:hypothetical protein
MPYTPSTLPPAQVAEAIVAQGVAKHRTRIDRIFFKAVRPSEPSISSCSLNVMRILMVLLGARRYHALLWWPHVTNRIRRLAADDPEQPGPRHDT